MIYILLISSFLLMFSFCMDNMKFHPRRGRAIPIPAQIPALVLAPIPIRLEDTVTGC
jgi:hypothetical protein